MPSMWGKLTSELAAILLAMAGVLVSPAFALAEDAVVAPVVSDFFWHPDDTHCRFVRIGQNPPEPGNPASWRFVFVTETAGDDLMAAERGYMRIGGLVRELDFSMRLQTERGEKRRYRTFGTAPLTVELEMQAGEIEKSKLGQTILVNYTGTITVSGNDLNAQIPFSGTCGVRPQTN